MDEIREQVRERYADAAKTVAGAGTRALEVTDGGCCGDGCGCGSEVSFGPTLYSDAEGREIPETALLASLGCGNPTAVAELREGETVLDLGSGGGIDVLLSAKRVGPTGKAYGLDMTEEMLSLARENARKAGATNVEFLEGYMEEIPLPDGTVDVIISNCVINLSTEKSRVFDEMHRVLRPGGRLGISDIVASDELTPEQRAERGDFAGCIAGALSIGEYEVGLEEAGFEEIEIETTHDVADRMYGAIVRARKPGR